MLFPYAKSSISLIFVQKTQFSSLKKRLFIAYITKILGGIFLICKNLSFEIVKSKIDRFRKVPCEHTVQLPFENHHLAYLCRPLEKTSSYLMTFSFKSSRSPETVSFEIFFTSFENFALFI